MTYVLGIRRGGVASIHSDSQLTHLTGEIGYESLKNGILFPGCIFGLAGDWEPGLQFIETVRRAVEHLENVADKWSMFGQVCGAYDAGQSAFDVLVSSRITGNPAFFLYHSQNKQLRSAEGHFYQLGTGKTLYEGLVTNFVNNALSGIQRWSDSEFHYFVHALLNESLAGESKTAAARSRVGGFFTFVLQDSASDARQQPTLLVHLHVGDEQQAVVQHCHRFAFEQHPRVGEVMFYCEKPYGLPPDCMALMQNVSCFEIRADEMEEVNNWAQDVMKRGFNTHPYYFMQAKVVEVPYYAPFADFRSDEVYFADLNDYLDDEVFNALMRIHEAGGSTESGWRLATVSAGAGRRWAAAPEGPD